MQYVQLCPPSQGNPPWSLHHQVDNLDSGNKNTAYLIFYSVGLMSFTHFVGIPTPTCHSSKDSTRQPSVTTRLLKPGCSPLKMAWWLEAAQVRLALRWERSWWSGPLSLQFANPPHLEILMASWFSQSAVLNNSPATMMVSKRHQLYKFRETSSVRWSQIRKMEITPGACIPMDERCDQFPNCPDFSDETDCQVMERWTNQSIGFDKM